MTYALGIDLGTTYTAAAVARGGRAEVAALGYRATSVPTVVLLTADGRFLVGDAAERRAANEPDRVAREFKRRVGDPTPLLLGGAPVSIDRCLAEVVRWVVDTTSETEGGPPAAVTVTHPANWGEFKRDVLRQALRQVDVANPRLVPEPVAAATWYAQAERMEPGRTIAVYDLGGGTFDTIVLQRRPDGGFESLGQPEGIERLGGIDVDEAVLGHVLRAVGQGGAVLERSADDPALRTATAQLRRACVEAKEALSSETSVTIPVWLPGAFQETRMNRSELEGLVEPLLRPTIDALARVVVSAGLQPRDLDAVLLVGGSSRIPLIAQQVSAGLRRPIAVDAHPKHPVALGAALDADAHLSTAAAPSTPAAGPPSLLVPPIPSGLSSPPARSAPPAWSSSGVAPAAAGPVGASPVGFPGPSTPPAWPSQGAASAAAGPVVAGAAGPPTAPASRPPTGSPVRTAAQYAAYLQRQPSPYAPLSSNPSLPPPVSPNTLSPSHRRLLMLAYLGTPITVLLVAAFFWMQSGGLPDTSTDDSGKGPSATTTAEQAAGAEATTPPAPPPNLLTESAAPAIDGFATIFEAPPRVRKLVLYPDDALIDVQVPENPTYVDEYRWDAGAVTGPEPQQLLDMEVEELEAKLFDLAEVDPAVVPMVTQQTLQSCAGEGIELTHVIIERDLVFDDQHRVLMSVYASHPERGGGGYLSFALDGTLVENYC